VLLPVPVWVCVPVPVPVPVWVCVLVPVPVSPGGVQAALWHEDDVMYEAMKYKKGYVRLLTNLGPVNLELYCDKVRSQRGVAICFAAPMWA
jgi:hypothetical protein